MSVQSLGYVGIRAKRDAYVWSDENRGFLYPGFILFGLGVGFVLSTLVSLKLSKSYGLIEGARSADNMTVSGS